MAQPPNPELWHYPRTEFAAQILRMFSSGMTSALTLFGPRRTGKTQFLFKDLAPLAEADGWHVVYATFWQSSDDPATVLATAMRNEATAPGGWQRVARRLSGLAPDRLKLTALGVGAEIGLGGATETADPLAALDAQFDRFNGRLLLLLDEVQDLADPRHAEFVAALRSSLDRRRDRVATVFTGSSLAGLRAMFDDRKAPFFHFGSNIELPPLDRGFVAHLCTAFATVSGGRGVDEAAALAFLQRVDRSPFLFRSALERMALNPTMDFDTAAQISLADLADRQGYAAIWAELAPLVRAVLWEISNGESGLTAKATRARMAKALGEDSLTPGRISGALRTLERRGLIEKPGKTWDLTDPELGRFVRAAVG